MRSLLLFATSLLLSLPAVVHGQWTFLDLPVESQAAHVMQRVGTTDLHVAYSRPSVNGRTIWGGIVPYDQLWRAGANENTVFTTTSDIRVEGKELKAGTYGLHMIPTTSTWTIIFSKDHASWGSYFYNKERDALRVTVTPKATPMTEVLTYDFAPVTSKSATLNLRWEKLEVPVRIEVDVHAVVLARMDDQLKGLSAFSWEPWYEAARYCYDEKIGGDRVMAWLDRSIAARPNFENQSLKAEVLADRGKKEEAETLRKKMLASATNGELNRYGYQLLQSGKKAEAVKIFELNAKRHADDPNVHDSLGEGYMANGQKKEAIQAFKKSLSMGPPQNVKANSIRCLKELGVDTSAWEGTKG